MYIPKQANGAATQPSDLDAVADDIDQAHTFVQGVLGQRVEALLNDPNNSVGRALYNNGVRAFLVAGGALLRGEPNDIDLFPVGEKEVTADTAGAVTTYAHSRETFLKYIDALGGKQLAELDGGSVKAQLCRATDHENLQGLINLFDFAHCQVGALVVWEADVKPPDAYEAEHTGQEFYDRGRWKVEEVAFTHHFLVAQAVQGTYYIPGLWPLRSLGRVPKVAAKLGLDRMEAQALVYQIMRHVADRGLADCVKEDPALAEVLYPDKAVVGGEVLF